MYCLYIIKDEDPSAFFRQFLASAKGKIIPLFLKKIFPSATSNNKYYIILADSGMGKSTMMINLYSQYKNKILLPFSGPKWNIRLLPLGAPNIDEEIRSIQDQPNTVLC